MMVNNPRNPFERRLRDEVRNLRQSEERQALRGIKEGYQSNRKNTLNRMDAYKNKMASQAKNMLEQQSKKIADHHGGRVDGDHDMRQFSQNFLRMLKKERIKESNRVIRDMKRGDKIDYHNAVTGMRRNQKKDEAQIVELARRIKNAVRRSKG